MNYYVDNTVGQSGNGSSWSSAWKNFSDINWSSIKPGDTVYVSGGTNGQTYNQTLAVGASGSAAAGVTIARATDSGHNGPVTIDGGGTLANGVTINGHNYVTVSGLAVRNISDAGFSVKGATAGVVIQNNSVYSGDPGGGNARGYDIRNNTGSNAVVVRNNSFSTPASSTAQTDGIYSSGNDGVVYQGNNIVISNSDTTGHSDGFQSYQDKNVTVSGNLFQQANSATVNNHGAWISDTQSGGVVQFYNNLVEVPNLTGDAAVTDYNEASWSGTGTADIWNNTIIGGHRSVNIDGSSATQVRNNILEPSAGGFGYVVADASLPGGNIDNNLLWAPNGSVAYVGSSTLNWSQWQANGYDQHGLNTDPGFTNAAGGDYSLSSASPAVDHGATVSAVTADYAGTPRPQGAGYDIGAYERPASGSAPSSSSGTTPATDPSAATAPASSSTAPDTLVLTLSEDMWQGDAQFTATVNGQSVGPAQAVTASHAQGQTQNFTFTGNWGSSPVDLGISFINDAWGGTAQTDRNLYVAGASYDGQTISPNSVLYGNGTQHFTV